MSQENVETVRRFFTSLGDATETPDEWLRGFTHEEVVYVEDPQWPGSGTYRGREAVIDCWSKYDDLLGGDALTTAVEKVHEAADQVVAIVRVAGRTREGDVPYDHTWGYLCRTENQRLTYFRAYFDPDEALEAAGLSE